MPRIASLLLLLFLPSTVFPQTVPNSVPNVLTLDEAVNLAVRDNRSVRISTLEVEKLAENINAFRTHRLPVIQISMMGSGLLTPLSFEFCRRGGGTAARRQ